ncbi:MAG: tRNA pseudouridine(55) synthase TruB [Bacilli bacterium]|nr:tRNA pseudouridine(55) synthase TruB [Bacilli bacterium]
MQGILLLNKPKGLTSHDCVQKVRKLFHTKKVGHIGTLDPEVTGVLPICLNEATKIIPFIENTDKEYIATVRLGYSTNTDDATGEIINHDESYKQITREELLSVLKGFIGEIEQVVPLYSAVKVNGKRLYDYAFNNEAVERPKRKVYIKEIELLSNEEIFSGTIIDFQIRVLCGKGTYIRTLAYDIGQCLGIPSHMLTLIRTKAGKFRLEDCVTFSDIEIGKFSLISMYDALSEYPRVFADSDLQKRIKNGQKLKYTANDFTFIVFHDIVKRVLAIYEKDDKNPGYIKPARVFHVE